MVDLGHGELAEDGVAASGVLGVLGVVGPGTPETYNGMFRRRLKLSLLLQSHLRMLPDCLEVGAALAETTTKRMITNGTLTADMHSISFTLNNWRFFLT